MNETNEQPEEQHGPSWSRQDTAVCVLGVVLLAVNVFPGYALANRAEPILLGMPFGMFWIVSWIVLGGLALLFIHRRWSGKTGEGER